MGKNKMNARYIKLCQRNHFALKFKINEVPSRYNSSQGEVDIFISISKKAQFRKVCLQTSCGKRYFDSEINNISWHGFYSKKESEIKLPVINFKSGSKKIETIRHTGTVNQKDIFLFPICSVYIPSSFQWDNLTKIQKVERVQIIKLLENRQVRVDFFVLPKKISLDSFLSDFSISVFYFLFDITMFDKSKRGSLETLPVEELKNDVQFLGYSISGWDVLVRLVYSDDTRQPNLDGHFSILLHDPNDAIRMLLNRFIAYEKENNSRSELEKIKERHSTEVKNYFR
jgi:hypothetical protein